MRRDMKKVIVESPKAGGPMKFQRDNIVTEESPTHDSIQNVKCRNWHTKNSGCYRYGPIKRFLQSKVGQPWDEVYSEICENAKDDLGRVLRERITDYVSANCRMEDGKVVNIGWHGFYIHPETKVLCAEKKQSRRKYEKPTSKIIELNGMEYYCHNEIWFRVKTMMFDKPNWRRGRPIDTVDDVFGNTDANRLERVYGCWRYVIWKQQANSKEIKQLKELENGT